MSDAVRADLGKLHPEQRAELLRVAAGKPAPHQEAPRPPASEGGRYR
jgi:hypothetical protein